MYDRILREDLVKLKSGATNITINNYIYNEMRKLLKCRTEDKINLIEYLVSNNIIDKVYYNELYSIIESDFNKGKSYINGFCSI